ncbi:MAG: family 20 glycosylhydrolase [Flavobacterium sp.]|jgi:hexosaminidase
MKYRILTLLLFFSMLGMAQQNLPLIPKPQITKYQSGFFLLNSNTVIHATDINSFEAIFLKENIKVQTGLDLKITSKFTSKNSIQLGIRIPDTTYFNHEQYEILVEKNTIHVSAFDNQGLFYGIQTLLQNIPFQNSKSIKVSNLNISDQPKFKWRGMHLDCARHFFSVDFIKKYIDYLAMYKLNTFHWHLTDDQGWRIEIKKYPKLTEIGAWRNGSMIGHYTDQTYDDVHYGGFYTQNQIKEVVAYAQKRHITIIPEIEMPGHAIAALAAYPEFSCTGGPFEVGKTWGVLDDVFCPKDETFTFLENILTEVIDLFPSEYIHIGGDESPKTRWKSCVHCQKRIKDENLKDEHELQSYFIQRIEKFVNSKGRKIIGWDEILEGGLAPNAAVMSWRGTEGGITAAKLKHFVVMTPGSHCYFDHYQGEPKNEPVAIGGYTNVEKVYSFNPIPKELSVEESKYILGAQANVWTEYINTPEHVEYMIMPRMAALSEVLWGTSNPKKYMEFEKRIIQHFDFYEKKGINYSKAIFEVTSKTHPAANGVNFELKAVNPNRIKYTIDGSEPNGKSFSYERPISITSNQTIKAAYFENEKAKSTTIEQMFFITKSTGKKIELLHQPHENYAVGGNFTLVDGMKGNPSKFGRDWLGFSGKDLNATINLGKIESISKISINTLSSEGSWIYYPKNIKILTSIDGINYRSITIVSSKEIYENKGKTAVEFDKQNVQFVKIIAENNGIIADGKPGAGSKSWLFADEISIE